MRKRLALALTVFVAVAVAAPAAMAAPPDGEKNDRTVFHVEEAGIPICGDVVLDVDGWFQEKTFNGKSNKNDFLAVYHLNLTYRNTVSGDTWTFSDRGPDHFYYNKNGDLVWTLTGRSSLSGVIGHTVVIGDDVEPHGKLILEFPFQPGGTDVLACDALT